MTWILWISIFAGGYVASIFTWPWIHTQIIGLKAKADQLRQKARDLEAQAKAKL